VPELPEVETVARDLRPRLVGATIVGARTNWVRTLRSQDPVGFADGVTGRIVLAVGRRAKQLVVELSGDVALTIHLKMTGQLFVVPAELPEDPYVRLVLELADGRELRFRDIRKFGKIGLYGRDPVTGELLEEVGLPRAASRLDDYPHRLSGGMRQRVMIAIAISCDPALLIADEPTTALDVTVQAQVLDLLAEMRDAHDMAMIVITHDMGVVADIADEVLVMYAGQVVEQAPVLELFDRPEHPYTEALLGALPQIEDPGVRHRRLTAIPGRPPDLLDPPETCRFAARCKYAGGDACTQHMPELRELRPGHLVRSEHPASERAGVREKVVT